MSDIKQSISNEQVQLSEQLDHTEQLQFDKDDATPNNQSSPGKSLTSFSKKKSFEVQEHETNINDQLENEMFMNLEQQVSGEDQNNNQEESKSKKSDNQSLKAGSYQTSDTEECKPVLESSQQKKLSQKLQQVEEQEEYKKNVTGRDKTKSRERDVLSENQQRQSSQLDRQSVKSKQKSQKSQLQMSSKHAGGSSKNTGNNKKQRVSNTVGTSSHQQTSGHHKKSKHTHQEQKSTEQTLLGGQGSTDFLNFQSMMQQNPWMAAMYAQAAMNPYQYPFMPQQPQMMNQVPKMPNQMQPPPQMMNPWQFQMQNQQFLQQQYQQQTPEQQQQQMQITLQQMKEQNQLSPQLLQIIEQQDQLKVQIEEITKENQQLSSEVQKQNDIQDNRKKIIQQSIDDQKKELINKNDNPKSSFQSEIPAQLQQPEQTKEEVDNLNQKIEIQEVKETTEQVQNKGSDPIAELEQENGNLKSYVDLLKKSQREQQQKISALEYENEILFGKSNSMDHSVNNYGKRLEEMNKQIDELNAILRIKDQEMIEMTNEIHILKMQKESMRKEVLFRKQREDQLEMNLKKTQQDLDKALREQEDLTMTFDKEFQESLVRKDENKRIKQGIEKLRTENQSTQELYESVKNKLGVVQNQTTEYESKLFSTKQNITRLRNENEQINVDLTYAKATTQNQRTAYDKLQSHFNKQVSFTNPDNGRNSIQPKRNLDITTIDKNYLDFTNPFESCSTREVDNYRGLGLRQEERHHKRSTSQDQQLIQSRNFVPQKERINSKIQLEGKIRKAQIDLTESYNQSITGQKRRGAGHSTSRDFINRNFVTQMQGILHWENNGNNINEYKEGGTLDISTKSRKNNRISMPDQLEPNSFRFGKNKELNISMQQQGINESQALPQRFTQTEVLKINKMQEDLTNFQLKKDRIQAQMTQIQEKTQSREKRLKRNTMEVELSQINQQIATLKNDLRKLDVLQQEY